MEKKTCSKCKLPKPLADFRKDKRRPDGKYAYCRLCEKELRAAFRAANPEASAKYAREWRERHKDRLAEIQAEYRRTHKDHIRKNSATYYDRHLDRLRKKGAESAMARRRANGIGPPKKLSDEERKEKAKARYLKLKKERPEVLRDRNARSYRNNIATIKARYKTETFREYMRSAQHKRRATLRGAGGEIKPEQIHELFNKQNGKCATCKRELRRSGKGKFHIDHVQSLSKKGANTIENIALQCPTCNLKKNNRDPYEWANQNGLLFI